MASVEAAYGGSQGSNFRLHLDATEVSVDTVNNRSLVQVNAYWKNVVTTSWWNADPTPASYNVGGNVDNTTINGFGSGGSSYAAGQTRNFAVANWQVWISHNSDGTGSVNCSASHDMQLGSSGGPTSATASLTLTLTTINRFASINSLTIDQITDTSFRINVSVSNTCDLLEYSLDGGSTYTSDSVVYTSTSVTVTGLTQNTTYPVVVRVRRQDSQQKTTSGSVNGATSPAFNFFFGDVI